MNASHIHIHTHTQVASLTTNKLAVLTRTSDAYKRIWPKYVNMYPINYVRSKFKSIWSISDILVLINQG